MNSGKSAVAPGVFDLRSGLGCGLGFAFRKSLKRLQIYPRVSLSIQGTDRGEIFQTTTEDFLLFVRL